MRRGTPKKIRIIGSVGSGKTTLAKELSTELNVPYHELDNVVWIRHNSGDIRRTEEEREEYLNAIMQSESWIIEGVHYEEWVANSFRDAELIIFLDTKYSIRIFRIVKRFLFQKLRFEESNYKPSIRIFLNMFKWNRYFEKVGKPSFLKISEVYCDKLLVASDKSSIGNYFG